MRGHGKIKELTTAAFGEDKIHSNNENYKWLIQGQNEWEIGVLSRHRTILNDN